MSTSHQETIKFYILPEDGMGEIRVKVLVQWIPVWESTSIFSVLINIDCQRFLILMGSIEVWLDLLTPHYKVFDNLNSKCAISDP